MRPNLNASDYSNQLLVKLMSLTLLDAGPSRRVQRIGLLVRVDFARL